jgi:hypothetical protein
MAHFLFQPDPIDGIKFKPIKIVDNEIFYDFQLNFIESVIIGTDRDEVLENSKRI